jgi:hypothetical protein
MMLPSTITDELLDRWERAASAREMTLSEFLIALIERELAREQFRQQNGDAGTDDEDYGKP